MYYLIIGRDKPKSAALRQANRPAHLAYWRGLRAYVPFGGPFSNEQGGSLGSMLVVEAADLAAAKALAAADPYHKAGLFAKVEILPWRWVLNAPAEVI